MSKLVLFSLFLLSACAVAEAGKKENESREAYVRCLEKNKNKPSKCDSLARIYQIHKDDYDRRINALKDTGNSYQNQDNQTVQQPKMWIQNMGGRTYNCNNIGGTVNCH
jgi:hypothetical protein